MLSFPYMIVAKILKFFNFALALDYVWEVSLYHCLWMVDDWRVLY
jgi:hypothetical protein